MYYLTACAVVKNEAPYLREWLEYHIIQGVEHFYIYNNVSTDETEGILKEYQYHGYVTYDTMPEVPIQFKAYNRCLKEHGARSHWMMFTDIDEFIAVKDHTEFASKLHKYEEHPGLALHWAGFGSNGQMTQQPGLVIERFTKRCAGPNLHVKSLVQPALTISVGKDPHTFYYKVGQAVDEHFRKLPKDYAIWNPKPCADNIWLNHYWVKSKEEFIARRKNPNAGDGRPYGDMNETFKAQDVNEVEDLTAQYWAEAVKRMIKYRGNQYGIY